MFSLPFVKFAGLNISNFVVPKTVVLLCYQMHRSPCMYPHFKGQRSVELIHSIPASTVSVQGSSCPT